MYAVRQCDICDLTNFVIRLNLGLSDRSLHSEEPCISKSIEIHDKPNVRTTLKRERLNFFCSIVPDLKINFCKVFPPARCANSHRHEGIIMKVQLIEFLSYSMLEDSTHAEFFPVEGFGSPDPQAMKWWSRRGSTPRPPRCHRGPLPTALRPHGTQILL